MKVWQMAEVLKDLGPDDDIFCAYFVKEEADDMAEEDLEQEFRFQSSEWAKIVMRLEHEEGIYQQLDEAFRDHVDRAIEKREDDATDQAR
jgi:hypothetical protein